MSDSKGTGTVSRIADYIKKHYVSILSVIFIIALIVVIYLNSDIISRFKQFGYAGAFLIGLIANATVIFPMPGLLLLFALGAVYNPVLIGIAGAAGGAIGELSGYFLGYSGRHFAANNKMLLKAEGWIKKWGSGAIFVFALLPFLPLDVAGVTAGVLRFPIWKFLLACFLGKAVLYIFTGLASAWGWDFLKQYIA